MKIICLDISGRSRWLTHRWPPMEIANLLLRVTIHHPFLSRDDTNLKYLAFKFSVNEAEPRR